MRCENCDGEIIVSHCSECNGTVDHCRCGHPKRSEYPEVTYVLYWKDGKEEEVTGKNIKNAFDKAGYGGGALGALDYYKIKKDT